MVRRVCYIVLFGVLSLSLTTGTPDSYPGDARFTQIIQDLLASVRGDAMDFPWSGRSGVTRQELCQTLAHQHYEQRNALMRQTNAAWVGRGEGTRAQLEAACLGALTDPSGHASAAGWRIWEGVHKGIWYAPHEQFQDEAHWTTPKQEPTKIEGDLDSHQKRRIYDVQRVHWPGRSVGRNGWNQSHPDVPYVWGWDPKENGDENGLIGAHLGFPFENGPLKWLVWITPKTAYLEGIDTSAQVARTVNGRQIRGFPKASTEFAGANGAGFGQWIVVR